MKSSLGTSSSGEKDKGLARSYEMIKGVNIKLYINTEIKLLIASLFSLLWCVLTVVLALPWIRDLAIQFSLPIAIAIVTGIAIIPGWASSFLVASLFLDKRPKYEIPEKLPPISILVAAYNEENNIKDTLTSINSQFYPGKVEVIVVNDGSKDRTEEAVSNFIHQHEPNNFIFSLVNAEKNGGKARALNLGLKYVTSNILITIDADTYLFKNSLANIVTTYCIGPHTAAIAGTVLVRNSRKNFWTKLQEWDYFHGIAVVKRTQSLFQGTLVAQGAFSLYNKAIIEEAGGWTDTIGEDIVLTWGLHKKNYRIGYAENAIVFTNVPETYKQFYHQRKRWARGLMEAFRRHPGVLVKFRLNTPFIFFNLMFPYMDFSYLFIFVPGLIAAIFFQYYLIVGLMTLVLLPLAIVCNFAMFLKQRKIFRESGLRVRRNFLGFIFYMLFYQLFMAPASFVGYVAEFLSLKKTWGTK